MNVHIYTTYKVTDNSTINFDFLSREKAIAFWKGLRVYGNWVTDITEHLTSYPVINGKVEMFDTVI